MADDLNDGADAQDQAEVFDETNITRDGDDIAHPDMARDVFDVTREDEDSEPLEAGGADFDPDLADEAELEFELELDDGVDEPRVLADDADLVANPSRMLRRRLALFVHVRDLPLPPTRPRAG